MAAFVELQDSPVFQKQIHSLEQTSDEFKGRCQKLFGGCKTLMTALGQACNGDTAFADSLERFSGGEDDPVGMSIGGPVISKFINAFHELASYKELLRSQVEHVLIDRLTHFMTVDLQGAKEARQRFDKSSSAYDQARERFVSLKKRTRGDIISELEGDLQNSKSVFEKSRFNLVNALMNVEAKKKYEFLESFSAIMDAHLRYFKLGYDLLSEMEPFIHQVLTYAQQSKEVAKSEQDKLAKRIQEFQRQSELDNVCISRNMESSTGSDGRQVFNESSYKNIEAMMQITANREIQTIKQGYLLKLSSKFRADRKRRFFVLDSHGTLYYYKNKGTKSMGTQSNHLAGAVEHDGSLFGRFRSRHQKTSLSDEKMVFRKVDLHASVLKIDSDDTELRLCFRIISPSKTYTLQAENEADRMEWINKITGVISSLLNSHFLQSPETKHLGNNNSTIMATSDNHLPPINSIKSLQDSIDLNEVESVSRILRKVLGNDICAECSSPEPEWASLNLGILICIQCSGVHRNLGVHISKVRSITLDVKVWEPTILDLFRTLGNGFCNSVWEELLLLPNERLDKSNSFLLSIVKPCPKDDVYQKEKYIQIKYAEKLLVSKEATVTGSAHALSLWEAVKTNNFQQVYRLIVTSHMNTVNTTYEEVADADTPKQEIDGEIEERKHDLATCEGIGHSAEQGNCVQGWSLLHLACHYGSRVMVELLLQFGANINTQDLHGRTPLHHCISKGNNSLSKFLLGRGARSSIRDEDELSALERAMESGAITDEELFILLTKSE